MDPIFESYKENSAEIHVSVLIESNFDPKDSDRIVGILSKSGGDMNKAAKLAANMAKAITDPAKAERRYQASKSLLGDSHPVTQEFLKGIGAVDSKAVDANKNTLGSLGSKSSRRGEGHDFKPHYMRGGRYNKQMGSAILPLGNLNFSTGETKMFNVLDTWGRENGSTAELWKDDNGKYKVVFTSGDGPIYKIGTRAFFNHDQNFRDLFSGQLIDWVNIGDLELLKKYAKSAPSYTYK